MREAVAAWKSAAAELFQCSGMVGKAVADVVQAQRVGQMGIGHGNDMACGAERTGLDPVLPGKVFDDSVRYPACNLGENGHNMLCRCHGVFYGCVWKPAIKMSMTPIFSTASSSFGTAVISKQKTTGRTIMTEQNDQLVFEESIEDTDAQESLNIPLNKREILSQPADEKVNGLRSDRDMGDLIVSPDFQRHYVWDRQKATNLIESALLGIPIPVIYLAEENDGRRSVIDGQQRLTSFFSFIDGKFPDGKDFRLGNLQVYPEYKGKRYSELPKDVQLRISKYVLHTITLKKESDPELSLTCLSA